MRKLLGIAVVLALGATTVRADSIDDDFRRARASAANGATAQSVTAMRSAAADLRLETPFGFSEALLVSAKAPRYGAFEPRPDNIFRPGDVVLVYAEPTGYGWRSDGDWFSTDLVVDAALLTADGESLWGQEGFGEFNLTSRYRFLEYMLNLELNITGLPAGDYVLEYTITDNIRGQTASISLPIVGK